MIEGSSLIDGVLELIEKGRNFVTTSPTTKAIFYYWSKLV